MSEPTEIELEDAVRSAERGLRLAREVFNQATREVAALEGIGGLWARIRGNHAARVDEATKTAVLARDEAKRRAEQLEVAREQLAARRREQHQALHPSEENQELGMDPRSTDDSRYQGMEAVEAARWKRLHLLLGVRWAGRDLYRSLERGSPDDDAVARLDAALSRSRFERWAASADPALPEDGLLELLRHLLVLVAGVPSGKSADSMQAIEARGQLELLEDRLCVLVVEAEKALSAPRD